MRRVVIIIIVSLISGSNFDKTYFHLDHSLDYSLIEYAILKSEKTNFFVMNQPYSKSQVFNLLKDTNLLNQNFISRHNFLEKSTVNFENNIGLISVDYDQNNPIKAYVDFEANINFNKLSLVNSINMDKSLKDDEDFHGDKKEWASAYIYNSYVISYFDNLEIFGGRTSRNLGVLNEYSLIFSNNPYPFDHFGFSAQHNKIKFSFYFTRLNNIKKSKDIQGIVIPYDYDDDGNIIFPEIEANRYFSFQRLDFKILENLQGSLSGSTVYGGPNQNFVADFINPLNLYYLSQRNNKVQMNNLYQLNLYYRFNNKIGVYFDFLIDDIIVNNEPGVTDLYDNRFGLMLKISFADFLSNKNLFSIRYVKIWNETYLSYRNFENYIFFNNGIGFPYNGFEGLKLSISYFKNDFILNKLSLESYRKGDNELVDIFNDVPQPFPSGEIEYGINMNVDILNIVDKNIEFSYKYAYNRHTYDFKELFKNFDSNTFHKFKLVYKFQY